MAYNKPIGTHTIISGVNQGSEHSTEERKKDSTGQQAAGDVGEGTSKLGTAHTHMWAGWEQAQHIQGCWGAPTGM